MWLTRQTFHMARYHGLHFNLVGTKSSLALNFYSSLSSCSTKRVNPVAHRGLWLHGTVSIALYGMHHGYENAIGTTISNYSISITSPHWNKQTWQRLKRTQVLLGQVHHASFKGKENVKEFLNLNP